MLELRDISFRYGALTVTDSISLRIGQSDALGVIGPNGAGKSTLLDLIMGTKLPAEGSIYLDGQDISRLAAQKRAELGIARAFQVPRPFHGMTVFENVLVGATLGGRRPERLTYGHCFEVLEKTGLINLAQAQASSLRLLDRKRLEMARALATKPRLLLLDEVAGGLTEMECQSLIETIRQIVASGVAIVWIEHIVHALLAVVNGLCVIDQGAQIANGDPHEVIGLPKVKEIYMGTPE